MGQITIWYQMNNNYSIITIIDMGEITNGSRSQS